MAKTLDLTPKMSMKSAERELSMPMVEMPLGQQIGGLQMYSRAFKRGYGDDVFGSDENGIWLGSADFTDAPFKVDMQGNVTATSSTLQGVLTESGEDQELSGDINVGNTTGGYIKIDGTNKRMVFNNGTTNRIAIGDV